ncbi:MAG: cytochrome P450 [Actinomycetota bacterium]
MTATSEFDPALVAAIDVNDPAFIADPYPALGRLREATPIAFDERHAMWWLTRFDDVQAMLRDSRFGRQYRHRYDDAAFGQPPTDDRWTALAGHERWSLFNLEPPEHTRLRRLIAKVFTPRAVHDMADHVGAVSDRLLDGLVEHAHFDVIADYGQPFSLSVICSMLGVPNEATGQVLAWSHDIVRMFEADKTDAARRRAEAAAAAFTSFVHSLIAEKRRNPDEGLVSRLVQVSDDGEQLTEPEIVSTTMVLLEAGHEATVNSLGNGIVALAAHPEQYAALVRGEADPERAVEEMMRFDPATQLFARWVLDPGVEIAGQPLPVGSQVGALFGAAQRDPRRFDAPDQFDVSRADVMGHLGFGAGIHHCLGASLARLELTTALQGLTARLRHLAVEHAVDLQPTFVLRGRTAVMVAGRG